MNPNLQIFFKRSIYVLVFGVLIAGIFYVITSQTDADFSSIGGSIAYGAVVVVMAGMSVLLVGFIVRSVWTAIMNRIDSIVLCCPDKKHDGLHIVASHYNSGGESESFSNYFHYYLDQNGKLHLSKRVEDEGTNISKSIAHLSEQTRLQLEPDRSRRFSIDSKTEDDKPKETTVPLSNGELHFLGYDGLMDYGFKVTFKVGEQVKWRVRI